MTIVYAIVGKGMEMRCCTVAPQLLEWKWKSKWQWEWDGMGWYGVNVVAWMMVM